MATFLATESAPSDMRRCAIDARMKLFRLNMREIEKMSLEFLLSYRVVVVMVFVMWAKFIRHHLLRGIFLFYHPKRYSPTHGVGLYQQKTTGTLYYLFLSAKRIRAVRKTRKWTALKIDHNGCVFDITFAFDTFTNFITI